MTGFDVCCEMHLETALSISILAAWHLDSLTTHLKKFWDGTQNVQHRVHKYDEQTK